jgi:hypothetical protein
MNYQLYASTWCWALVPLLKKMAELIPVPAPKPGEKNVITSFVNRHSRRCGTGGKYRSSHTSRVLLVLKVPKENSLGHK